MKLYLDVDGVINANMPMNWGRVQQANIPWSQPDGTVWNLKISWAPGMIAALSAIPLELVWATTWQESAPELLSHIIGFGSRAPFLRPLRPRWQEDYSIEWKFESMRYAEPADGHFVWIDDEIDEQHRLYFPNALVITSNPLTGISVKDIEKITDYVAQHDVSE